jgi:hypothetical protein
MGKASRYILQGQVGTTQIGLAHPEAFGFDAVADRLFTPRHVILIKQCPHLFTAPLIYIAFDGVVAFQHFLDLVGGSDGLQ